MYQYECFYSRINPSIIGTQTEHRYKGEGSSEQRKHNIASEP